MISVALSNPISSRLKPPNLSQLQPGKPEIPSSDRIHQALHNGFKLHDEVGDAPFAMKTLDGGGRRASGSAVKDFVSRRMKHIPNSISVEESTANSSSSSLDYVCEPTLSSEQTRLPPNEGCSLDSSDSSNEYRSYRSIRSAPSGSGPRTSVTSSVGSGFDGCECASGSEEDRGRGRSKRTLFKSGLIVGWPSTGHARRQPPRPRRIQSIDFDDKEDETVEELAQDIIDEISRSQKDTRKRGRRTSDDRNVSNNSLNDSFNSMNGALQGIRSSLTISKRRFSAVAADKSSSRPQDRSQRCDPFHTANSTEFDEDEDQVGGTWDYSGQKAHHPRPQRRNSCGSRGSFHSQSTSASTPHGRRVSFKKKVDVRIMGNVVEFDQFYTQDDDTDAIEEILSSAKSTRKLIRQGPLSSHGSYNKMTGLPSPEALREGLPCPEIIVGIEHLLCRSGAEKANAAVKKRHSQALFNEQARQEDLGIVDPQAIAMVLEMYSDMSAKLAECRAMYAAAI